LDAAARSVIEDGLRDNDAYVRGHADSAADDVEMFLRWKIPRPN
jgi:hypothetical protein